MTKKLLAFMLSSVTCFAQASGELPDRNLTPGATVPVVLGQMCVIGYSRAVRNVPVEEKREVFRRYGIAYVPNTYEVDHLIPLELGGSNSAENLWPQPLRGEFNAHMKDQLENRLRWMVCDGMIPLAQAQQWIAQDWIAAYREVFAHSRRRRR